MSWFVYLIECADASVYTGICVNVEKRYALHCAGKGARYTRSRPPTKLIGSFAVVDRSIASKAEYAIKQLPATQKIALFKNSRSAKQAQKKLLRSLVTIEQS